MSPPLRPRTVLVVAVLVVATAGPAGATAALHKQAATTPADLATVSDMPNMLQPAQEDTPKAGYATADVDLSAAIAATTHTLRSSVANRTYLERMRGASSPAQRRVTRQELQALERQIEGLRRTQGSLRRGYENGTLSREAFLRRYGTVQVAATQVNSRLDRVETYLSQSAAAGLIATFYSDIRRLEGELVGLHTRVADELVSGLTGASAPVPIYVAVGADASVLAAYDGGRFLRAATEEAHRDRGATDQFAEQTDYDIAPAIDRAFELYPWVRDNTLQEVPNYVPLGSLYRVSANHPLGRLVTYLDGGTTDVYHEAQVLRPAAVTPSSGFGNATDALTLEVSPTIPTGPMRVQVRQTSTQAPVSGTVLVNGHPLGEADSSGTVWAVQPRGSLNVTAVHDGNVVTATGP